MLTSAFMGFWRTGTQLALSAVALGASLVASERAAHATDCTGTLASTCINDDTLWPHAGGGRFLGVGGTETIAAGQPGFGLVSSYLSRPIILHTPSPGPNGTDQHAIDNQVNGSFLFAYGVTNRFELDVVLPVTFGQGGTGVMPLTGGAGLQDTAMRDIRLGMAYALLERARVAPSALSSLGSTFGVTARIEASAPTGDRGQFAGERTAVWIPSVAADWRRGKIYAGAQIGARFRPTTELVGARIGTQALVGVGVGYDVLDRELLSLAVEARALPTFSEQHDAQQTAHGFVSTPNGKHITPAEWTVSARTSPLLGGDLGLQIGGGGGIPLSGGELAPTTPRFRFTVSIRYAPLARDTDGDGVLDKDDKCPDVKAPPGPRGVSGQPNDGCPHAEVPTPTAAPKFPLRLSAPKDICQTEPDVVDGFRDSDACPDEDADADGIPNRYDKCPLVSEDFAGTTDGCPEKK